ncbi:MAG: 50S ribosomal protein L21 [Alphaproteobacteria bacterium]|nr:50S ribosomal protein L21 [Alphaproteobacteria bacterium]
MFAIIRTGGKQYKVQPNTRLIVEKIEGDVGAKFDITDVLMIADGDQTTMGAPVIEGAKVVAEIIEQGRGEKVIIFKKRRRQNYRRKNGHRQLQTTIKIMDIKAA